MRSYCTITSAKRTLEKLYLAEWGLFITPDALERNRPSFLWSREQSPPMPFAIDNGAWGAFTQGRRWEEGPFLGLLHRLGAEADFAVVPDIVEGGVKSLELSLEWLPEVRRSSRRALIPVQDGMDTGMLEQHLCEHVGVFVGGSTEFKEATLRDWARLAKRHGAWCHVGRVNSVRRVNMCTTAGVDSVDGTSVCRFSRNLAKLNAAGRQLPLLEVLDG